MGETSDVRGKYASPSIDQLAFNCPHCGALAKQYWFHVHAEAMRKDQKPTLIEQKDLDELRAKLPVEEEFEAHERMLAWAERMLPGRPLFYFERRNCDYAVGNVSIARCYNCDDISIWFSNRLVWPSRGEGPAPNPDLPDDIRIDYEEADRILDLSPRGAAALLRLAIQKLCKHLGKSGGNINADIAALVQEGLDTRVQKALDIVRVVGNHAVHPGQIDLRDDKTTAERLFGLVNLICEKMISEPKHVEEMYEDIPEATQGHRETRQAQIGRLDLREWQC